MADKDKGDLRHVRRNSLSKRSLKELPPNHPPTSYFESIVHLFKGNVGTGVFGLGDAFKNGGILVGLILTAVIGIICVHCEHILVSCSEKMRLMREEVDCGDYAETVEQCFQSGPERFRSWSKHMKRCINVFICITQLGFCCIYIVFVSTNLKQILSDYGHDIELRLVMLMVYIPVLVFSLITSLKFLAPVSLFANLCMIAGLALTLYQACKDDLPSPMDRKQFTGVSELSLSFGTIVFAFEGIALVLPLRNSMLIPENFERPLGVLNVGMVVVGSVYILTGFIGYLKYGEEVGASLTLNLGKTLFAQIVKSIVAVAVSLTYPLQFFIAISILWPQVMTKFHLEHRPYIGELIFRFLMVTMTLAVAELVPALGLFMSLIGSFASTALALVFPPIIEFLLTGENKKGPMWYIATKNILILILAMLGFLVGTVVSITEIIKHFGHEEEVNIPKSKS